MRGYRDGEPYLYSYDEAGYRCTICNAKAPAHHAARGSHTRMHVRKDEAKEVLEQYPLRSVYVVVVAPPSENLVSVPPSPSTQVSGPDQREKK
jgi:hypothetical protein